MDNSERGYSLVKEVESSQKFPIETGALFNEAEKENGDHAYKIDVTFVLEVEFSFGVESVTIEEYDKNGNCVYKTDYYTADNLESESIHSKYITQDDMRYVDLYVDYYIGEEENPLRSFISLGKARGDEIKIPIETYYGYLISKTVKIY